MSLPTKKFNEKIKEFGGFLFNQVKEGCWNDTKLESLISKINEISKLEKFQPKAETEKRTGEELLEDLLKPEDEISGKDVSSIKASNIYLGRLVPKDRMEFVVTRIDESFKTSWLRSQVGVHLLLKAMSGGHIELERLDRAGLEKLSRLEEDDGYLDYLTRRWAPYLSSPNAMSRLLDDVIPKLYFNTIEYSAMPYLRCYRDATQVVGIKPELCITSYKTSVCGRISYIHTVPPVSERFDKPTYVIGLRLRYYYDTHTLILDMNELLEDFVYTPDEIVSLYNLANILNLTIRKKMNNMVSKI